MSHHHHSHHDNDGQEFNPQTEARVGQFPGILRTVPVAENTVIGDILAAVELRAEGYELRINDAPASIADRVEPGDTVYLVRAIKGN